MNTQTLKAHVELIDASETGCVDPVFKEACLAILPRAKNVLSDKEFKHIVKYAEKKINERITPKT